MQSEKDILALPFEEMLSLIDKEPERFSGELNPDILEMLKDARARGFIRFEHSSADEGGNVWMFDGTLKLSEKGRRTLGY